MIRIRNLDKSTADFYLPQSAQTDRWVCQAVYGMGLEGFFTSIKRPGHESVTYSISSRY
jgi:hypothetical protein